MLLGRCGQPLLWDISRRGALADLSPRAGWTVWRNNQRPKGPGRCSRTVHATGFASGVRGHWAAGPPVPNNRCLNLLFHTRYAVIAGYAWVVPDSELRERLFIASRPLGV